MDFPSLRDVRDESPIDERRPDHGRGANCGENGVAVSSRVMHDHDDAPPDVGSPFPPLDVTKLPKGEFFATILSVEAFDEDERRAYEAGFYPIRISTVVDELEDFVTFLVERSLATWAR